MTLCKIEIIGEVRLQMFDGTIRDLKDVQYVLDKKKNFILLGVLVDNSLYITLADQIWRLLKVL